MRGRRSSRQSRHGQDSYQVADTPDRCFYLVLSGGYVVAIDDRLVRTLGPDDHLGELAAGDWEGGYGYARLPTVRCAESGRPLKLTGEDLQWLVDTEPAVNARIAETVAVRLEQR
jgi:CRP-like cAMP-binding protein